MDITTLNEKLEVYYPKLLSSLTDDYEKSMENKFRANKIFEKNKYWETFIKAIKNKFPSHIIHDRTDEGVSHILIIYFPKGLQPIMLVLCFSKLLNVYCYYSTPFDQLNLGVPKFRLWNEILEEYNNDFQIIFDIIKVYFVEYELIQKDIILTKSDYYASAGNDIGEANFIIFYFLTFYFLKSITTNNSTFIVPFAYNKMKVLLNVT